MGDEESFPGEAVHLRLKWYEHMCRDAHRGCEGGQRIGPGRVRKLMLTARGKGLVQSKFVSSIEEAQSIARRLGVEIPVEDIAACR